VDDHLQELRRLLRRQKVADMSALQTHLEGRSRRSLFRDLASVGYRTSFTHTGRYYTLTDLPDFDELGLWFYRDVGFSRAGTLKQTIALLVDEAPEGRSHADLRHVLRVRVHNTLLDLVGEGRIGRDQIGRVHLYVNANPDRAAQQVERRRELETTIAEALRVPTVEEVVEVLVETLRAAPEVPEPDVVAKRLAARGVRLEPRHVGQVFDEHGLVPGKNGATQLGALSALRARIVSMREQYQQRMRGLGSVEVFVSENPGWCPLCGESMGVQKTGPRTGWTLAHGAFEARETIHSCSKKCRWRSGALVIRRATCLSEVLLPGSNAGYDVMVFVGLERFLRHRQREEIQVALGEQGIDISTGEVSKLSRKFVRYLARLHRARAEKLKAVLEHDGGWPLHVDATGEAGRGTMLAVIAGWRKWVLGSWKISTERTDLILPCLREVVRRFGPPCAAMRDLGKAITPALNDLVTELHLTIPVLACHQHFLADVGKDLLEPGHAELRSLFRRFKVRSNLRALVRDLGRELGTDIEEARQAVLEWQSLADAEHRIDPGRDGKGTVRALAQWVLDFKAQATGLDFPFDRPYLDLFDRAMTALRATDAFLRTPPEDKKVTRLLKRFHRYLEPVASEVPFRQVAARLHCRAALFDELRQVLRVVATLPEGETVYDLDQMHEQLDELVTSLTERRPDRGPAQDTREAIDLILQHIETHGNNLWGHAIRLPDSAGGGIRLVSRTNFLAENFFGGVKHDERRRSGHKNLGYILEHLPDEAALVRNLVHDDYVATVCGSLDDLPNTFAKLDRQERETRLNAKPPQDQEEDLGAVLQMASASLSPADRRVVRTQEMDRRVAAAARSRAPRCRC